MFIVFEGIDGGGKTTLSNLVAGKLRDAGLRVAHVREGGKFASAVTQAMRELGRDAKNVALTPRAELMLYLTREVQLFDEATRPAIESSDIVIADRYHYTAEVLAVYGRGLPAEVAAPLVTAALAGVEPDLVVFVDVDPVIARARRRVSKIVERDEKPPSRKGLAGTALQQRLRQGYKALAARDPKRWVVVDNTDADLHALVDAVTDLIRAEGRAEARARIPEATGHGLSASDPDSARTALLAWIDRRAVREPGLAAYFLDGLFGEPFDARRLDLAARAPVVIATGLRWLDDPVSWKLRHQLAEAAPDEVARSIVGVVAENAQATPLLRSLVDRAPRGTGDALVGRDDAFAWEMRERLPGDAALASVTGLGNERAWQVRESWLAARGGASALEVLDATRLCDSISGLADARAWELRKALRDVAPIAALESIRMLTDDRSWKWRERHLERAPKAVMKTLVDVADARAWPLRERVADRVEEVYDTIYGLDDPQAWALRDQALTSWAASAVKSLGPLASTERGAAFVRAALAKHPTNVALWRHAIRVG
jgi:dTMP kinase